MSLSISEDSLNNNSIDIRIDSDYAYIADVSDIHVGNMYHNKKAFFKFLDNVNKVDNLRLIIGGDSTDSSSLVSSSSVFEESNHGLDQILEIKKKLEPIKDKILFIRSGNHGYERSLKHGKLAPEQILAEFLGVPFFHGCGTAFVNVRKNCYVIGTWHNSRKPQNMEWIHTDVSFYEHLHKNSYERLVVAEPNKFAKRWSMKECYHVQTGSYLGWGGYSADKGHRPTVNATPVVELSGINGFRNINVYDTIEQVIRINK